MNEIYADLNFSAPGPPEDIKVFPTTPQSFLISWLPPNEPNGVITKYNLYTRYYVLFSSLIRVVIMLLNLLKYIRAISFSKFRIVNGAEELNHAKRNLPGSHTTFEMKNIQQQVEYQFWITAVTRVGEGQSSSVVSQTASAKSKYLFVILSHKSCHFLQI